MVKTNSPACPKCGGPTSRHDSTIPGIKEWHGCKKYPACNGKVRVYEDWAKENPDKTIRPKAPAVPINPGGPSPVSIEETLALYEANWEKAPAPQVPAKRFTPSKYQQAIFDFVQDGKGHGVVEAVAGSGKTTTLVEALEKTRGKVLFTAFNAAIAAELKRRAPGHVQVSTLHGLGLLTVQRNVSGKVVVDKEGQKLRGILSRALPDADEASRNLRRTLGRVVGLAKATLVDVASPFAVAEMLSRYGVDVEANELPRIHALLGPVLAECRKQLQLVDFDDMIWLPVVEKLAPEKFDWVFVDEAQDLNASQLELVLRTVKGSGRILAVGDRHQSIYGFRGADTEAIPKIIKALDAKILPLSITYRCPTTHVELAQRLVPALEAAPGAKKGEVGDCKEEQLQGRLKAGDLVLCRTNAPLIAVAFALIRAGKKAIIRGRDIGQGLIALVRKLTEKGHGVTVPEFLAKLTEYRTAEVAKLVAAEKQVQAESLRDRCETIEALADDCNFVEAIVSKIESVFSDVDDGVICSSVHRAKGFEAERVFILRPDLLPHPAAKRDWEREQEANIEYVALTRSKKLLVFVEPPPRGRGGA